MECGAFDKPPPVQYDQPMATKRSTKPFSRNPKNKAHVRASQFSQKKAVIKFQQKEAQPIKLKRLRSKVAVAPAADHSAAVQPQLSVKVAAEVLPDLSVKQTKIEEEANKLALTQQLVKITQTLKALKAAEREKCARRIYAAETKAMTERAAVYRKAKQAGKFPTSWTYPKPEVQPPFEFTA